jgi:hypothetical protein
MPNLPSEAGGADAAVMIPRDVLATAQAALGHSGAVCDQCRRVAAALLAERERCASLAETYTHDVWKTFGHEIAAIIRQRAADAETADHVDPLAGRAPRHGL